MKQYDFEAGLDISSLTSVTQEQLMSMVNQIAPLTNIGLVYVGTVRPDITSNPRMINYIWLDVTDPATPVFKRYIASRTVIIDADASWGEEGTAIGAITTAMMALRSVTGGINLNLLKLNSDYSATGGSSYYVLRVAANGKDIEAVSIDTAISDSGGLSLARLDTTGIGANKYLGVVAGALAYKYLDPSSEISASLNNRIPAETAILPGSARYILRTNATGLLLEWVSSNDASLFSDSDIAIAKLDVTGAVANDIIRYNGTSGKWERVTPSLRIVAGDVANAGILSANDLATKVHTIPHLLGAIPKLVRVRCKCIDAGGDLGWAQNDEVDVESFRNSATNHPAHCVGVDVTNVTVTFTVATLEVANKATGVMAAIDETKWHPIIYAWL